MNELITKFVFIDSDLNKVDSTRKSLFFLNTDLNNLGKDLSLGKNITDSLKPAETALDSLSKKIDNSTQKPTISRYWEAEENKTVGSLKAIENAATKTVFALSNIADSSSLKTKNKPLIEQPKIKFAADKENFIDLDKLQKKADDTRKSFADISAQRLNNGNINSLTNEIVTAHERSKQLVNDIKSIKAELANPNRKSSVRFLTDELLAAEKEADRLNRKLSSLPNSPIPSRSGTSKNGGRRGGITNNQATFLELTDDFAPEGFNRAYNAAGRAAFAAQNIKDTAKDVRDMAKDMSLFSGFSITTLGVFAAIAAAGYLIVDATSKIRAEAEKRLKAEDAISAAGNRQVLLQRESLKNFIELRKEAENSRLFSSALQTGTIDGLKNRRATLEKIVGIDPASEQSKIYQNQILQIDAQLSAIQQRNTKLADDAFNQRWENWKKSQENAIEAERKFQIEVEKGKNKIIELGKIYKSALDELYQKRNADNPFVQVFAESRNELDKLKESIKGLPEDMQRAAIASQRTLNRNKLFETQIDNNLSILDLKGTADKFRSAGNTEAYKKLFEDAVRGDLSRGNFYPNFGGTYGSFIANKAGGFDKLTDAQKRDIYEVNQLKNLSGNLKYNSVLDGNVNDRSLISRLARERVANPNENLSINERLQKQIDIINSGVSSEAERAIADRKLLAIGGTLDPSQIRSDLREQIAAAADRQAEEKSNFEKKNFELETQKLASQEKLIGALNKLSKIAEEQGIDGVNKAVEFIFKDETKYGVDTGAAGTQADVNRTYFDEAN